ncbi:MAG: hypothetical protein SFY32_08680 [Bacteroidota bacterium]|nr:hypothetical protein [Bacteroidota bacterium]
MKHKLFSLIIISTGILLVLSCSENKSGGSDEFNELSRVDTSGQVNEATSELATEVIKSIPPPVEIETMIKNSGAEYNSSILNNAENYKSYSTNYLKAINLGVYGADLGYINIYNHKEDALTYLNTVVKLAEDLKVGQFFDYETIKRIANNNQNLDSLLDITTTNFEKMNNYLQEQDRSNISMYMLTGGWLEALNISCTVALGEKNKALYEKIGEQKVVLDQILLLLGFYKGDPNAVELNKALMEVKSEYDKVKIETIYAEPTMVEENGALVVKDNSKTVINITEENVKMLDEKIKAIRKKIVS